MREPLWISDTVVLAIHERQMAEHGGTSGIRDEALLASALARPKNLWSYGGDVDVPALVGAHAFGIARNDPFVDGNKSTAYVVCRTFLVLNGWDLTGPLAERYPVVMALASGELDEQGFVDWLRAHARPGDLNEARSACR